MNVRSHIALAAPLLLLTNQAFPAQEIRGLRARLKGLVYEIEDWTTPKDGWLKDQHPARKWCLWTEEQDVWSKRSMGQSLQSPRIESDRERPEDGAPALHTRITGIPQGFYLVYMNHPCRAMAISSDGKTWQRCLPPWGEVCLGAAEITDGTFELWVDDRYAMPGRLGSCYYDYIRFEESEGLKLEHFTTHVLPDGRNQLSWTTSIPLAFEKLVYGESDRLDRETALSDMTLRNHRVVLDGLKPGTLYRARPVLRLMAGGASAAKTFEFVAKPKPTGQSAKQQIDLVVAEPTAHGRNAWPVSSGVPLKAGQLWDAEHCLLQSDRGKATPAQFRAMGYWPDGSIKWLNVVFMVSTEPEARRVYRVVVDSSTQPLPSSFRIDESENSIMVSNGKVRLVIDRMRFSLLDRVYRDFNSDGTFDEQERMTGEPMVGNGRLVTPDGKSYGLGQPDGVRILERGPVRFVAVVKGAFVHAEAGKLFRYRARYALHANDDVLHLTFTLGNDDTKQTLVNLQSADLRLPIQTTGPVEGSVEGSPFARIEKKAELSLLQDRDDHYSAAAAEVKGEHALGLAAVKSGRAAITVAVRDFWQRYPKGLAVKKDGLHIRLLPALPADVYSDVKEPMDVIRLYYWCDKGQYRFRSGMQYTTELAVRLGADAAGPAFAEHVQNRLFAAARPSTYCSSGAFERLDAVEPDLFPSHEAFVSESYDRLEASRQQQHEYGWMNHGDWFGERRYNWGNSEYDLAWGMAAAFARTGDLRYLWRGDQMARHYVDIDTRYLWDGPHRVAHRAYAHSVGHTGGFFKHGNPWFTQGSYSRPHGGAFMNGAANLGGHCVEQGQLVMAMLMGEDDYLDSALGIADQIASVSTRNFSFGIERSAGWPLVNVMAAYEVTGNPYYLNAARLIMEKVYELQDPDTGGWRMRQGPPECDCPDAPHTGGKTFAVGILLRGLVMLDVNAPDPQVKRCIMRACDWLMNHAWNEEKFGFRYKTGCPKFIPGGGLGTSASVVAEGLAYASEITGDPKYRSFLLRFLAQVMRSRASNGKTYSMLIHHSAYPFYYLKRAGLTKLPPPQRPTKVNVRKRAFLDASGRGTLDILVIPGTELPARVTLLAVDVPSQLQVRPDSMAFVVDGDDPVSRELLIATRGLDGPCRFGLDVRVNGRPFAKREVELLPRTTPERFRIGKKLGFLGAPTNETLLALRAAGLKLTALPALSHANLNGYGVIVVGRDTFAAEGLYIGSHFFRLTDFARSGGTLVMSQLNDSDWEPGYLPGELTLSDANDKAGKIVKPQHPLFSQPNKIDSITDIVCYDTIVHAQKLWTVLAVDSHGQPAILEAAIGSGRALLIEPSLDRAALDPNECPEGLSPNIPKQFMQNVARYCQACVSSPGK